MLFILALLEYYQSFPYEALITVTKIRMLIFKKFITDYKVTEEKIKTEFIIKSQKLNSHKHSHKQ